MQALIFPATGVLLLGILCGCAAKPAMDEQTFYYRIQGNQIVLSAGKVAGVDNCVGAVTSSEIRSRLGADGPEGRAVFRLRKIAGPKFPPMPVDGANIVHYERRAVVQGQSVTFECSSDDFYWIDGALKL